MKLKSRLNSLEKALAAPVFNERNVKNTLEQVSDFLEIMEDSHFKYMWEEKDDDTKNNAQEEYDAAMSATTEPIQSAQDKLAIGCPSFQKASNQQKAEMAEKHSACQVCLSWAHTRDSCNKPDKTCPHTNCNYEHNYVLHGTSVAYAN